MEAEEYPLLEAVTRKRSNEDTVGWKRACGLVICVEISDSGIIKRNYELCVKMVNKSNIQSKTPSRVSLTRGNIFWTGERKCPYAIMAAQPLYKTEYEREFHKPFGMVLLS
jgi:hypothetical protein